MARTLILDTITEPNNTGTANITLASSGATTLPSVNIDGGSVDGTTLGASTPSTVAATSLSTTGNATVGGTLGVTGETTMNGDVTLGNASGDTITVTGTMAGIDNKSGMTGEMRMWSGSSAPTGWLLCDGASVSRSTYAALYAITGDAFGTASGSTFNVPDMRGRMPVGVGTGIGGAAEDPDGGTVPVGGSALTARSLGEWTGAEVLSSGQLAAHTHTGAAHTHTMKNHTHTSDAHTHTFTAPSAGGHVHTLTQGESDGSEENYGLGAAWGGAGLIYSSQHLATGGAHTHSGTSDSTTPDPTGFPNDNTSDSTTPGAGGPTGSGSKFTTPIMCVNFIIKT